MQAFEFEPDIDLMPSLGVWFCLLLIAKAVSWISGYFYNFKDPYDREDLAAGRPRAKLWALVTAAVDVIVMIYSTLTWQNKFNRMELYPEGSATLYFQSYPPKTLTLSQANVDSIHYGLQQKASACYVRIQLKTGKSYQRAMMNFEQSKSAYWALKASFRST